MGQANLNPIRRPIQTPWRSIGPVIVERSFLLRRGRFQCRFLIHMINRLETLRRLQILRPSQIGLRTLYSRGADTQWHITKSPGRWTNVNPGVMS